MLRIPFTPPAISKVPPGEGRPLWSVMIPVYNCLPYMRETLQSVLDQEYSPAQMQIEVVDDASTDGDVYSAVQELGKGRIGYYQQNENVGSLVNFATCIGRSRGHYIHLLHGDDRVRPGYYNAIGKLLEDFPEAGAAFCNFVNIDQQGRMVGRQPEERMDPGMLENWLLKIAEFQRIQYVAMTVKREVYEQLGAFYGLNYGEDWEMWVRIARHFPVAYTPQILAEYRKHDQSISSDKFLTAEYMQDLSEAMLLIQVHLDKRDQKAVLAKSKKFYSHYALRIANQLWTTSQNKNGVKNNVKAALRLHKDINLFYKISKLYAKIYMGIR